MQSYSRKQVGEILGVTPRTVWFYTENGIVTPEVHNPQGKGTTRLYSPRNVMEIAVARKLAEHGLKLDLVREILRGGRLLRSRDGFNPWDPGQNLESEGSRYFLLIYDPASERPKMIATSTEPGQDLKLTDQWGIRPPSFEVCIAVDLTAIREKVRAALL